MQLDESSHWFDLFHFHSILKFDIFKMELFYWLFVILAVSGTLSARPTPNHIRASEDCDERCDCSNEGKFMDCASRGLRLFPGDDDTSYPLVKILDLTDNKIERLPSDHNLKSVFPALECVDLSKNPFQCHLMHLLRVHVLVVSAECGKSRAFFFLFF